MTQIQKITWNLLAILLPMVFGVTSTDKMTQKVHVKREPFAIYFSVFISRQTFRKKEYANDIFNYMYLLKCIYFIGKMC